MADRICTVEGCDRKHEARGLCPAHRNQWQRTGQVPTEPLRAYRRDGCEIEGCENPHRGRGLCNMHLLRLRTKGDPMDAGQKHKPPRIPEPGLDAVHRRLDRDRGKASTHPCAHCGRQAKDWAYDWQDPDALVSPRGTLYSLGRSHYMPLCTPCHRKLDWPHQGRARVGAPVVSLA
jgi:hypothetical protein